MTRAAAILLAIGALLPGPAAHAYVISRSNGCHVTYWPQSCVYIQPDSALTPDLSTADAERLIQTAISSWETPLSTSATFLKINYMAPNGPKETRFDHVPVIKFRTDTWAKPSDCGGGQPTVYDPSAAALTTVYFVDKPSDPATDGMILDADIEVNNVNNYFYEAMSGVATPPDPRGLGRSPADLWNTLTHELGHFQGLAHTCLANQADDAPASCTLDQNGQRPPLCAYVLANMDHDPALATVANTTMFATAQPRETKKRIPKADDIAGIVADYPAAQDPHQCSMPQYVDPCDPNAGHGCAAGDRRRVPLAPLWPLAAAAGVLLLLRARRRRL